MQPDTQRATAPFVSHPDLGYAPVMSAILERVPLGFPWATVDPFLFCVHHDDRYPKGNERMGPDASLSGRNLGQDFEIRDGWRMYHGKVVPGFPQHPHRGFETVTIARRGYIDHSDSLGAAARFGEGDVQWLTAGAGIVHSEMFPLLQRDEPNPVELFQIWLNLGKANKLVQPHFSMLWDRQIPRRRFGEPGRETEVTVIAGPLGDATPPPCPPHSWARDADHDVAIWSIRMEAGARWTMPATRHRDTIRTLYFFRGERARIGGEEARVGMGLVVQSEADLVIETDEIAEFLLLQGRPIGEPVVQHGPFVMNTREEIQRAFTDYQRTGFGGWPWPVDDPVHPREARRFARHADGSVDEIS